MSLPEILDWYEYCEFLLVSSLLTVATMVIITQGKIHIMNVWPTLGNHHTTSPYYTTVTFEQSKSQLWSAPKSQERAILSMFKVSSRSVPIRNEVAARQSPPWVNFFSTCLLWAESSRPESDWQLIWCGWFRLVFNSLPYKLATKRIIWDLI